MANESEYVTLLSQDEQTFQVKRSVTRHILTINAALEGFLLTT
jgi:hypothetical protein